MKSYVDKNINCYEGEEAEKLLQEHNDEKFMIKNVGRPVVDIERWKEAQHFEKTTWCDKPGATMVKIMEDDHNREYEQIFGGYEQLNFSLPNKPINMIELGCGPFTNLRLIIPKLFKHIERIDLLDPLINDYLNHSAKCKYKNGYLNNLKVNLYPIPIEQFIIQYKYHLVVMLNVIPHCYDIDLIFQKIDEMLDDDGVFIFHEKFLPENRINEINDHYDAGHPLELTYKYIDDILKKQFKKTIYNKISVMDSEYDGRECVYKILKK